MHDHGFDPPQADRIFFKPRWSSEQEAMITEGIASGLSYKLISRDILNRTGVLFTPKAIESKYRRFGERRDNPHALWTKEADDFIRENLDKLSYRNIGAIFGKSPSAVSGRVHRLGLSHAAGTEKKLKSLRATLSKGDRPKPRPKLRIVDGGAGTQRTLLSVQTDMPVLAVADVTPLNLTLAELPDNGCRYIAGEPTGGCYCGHPQLKGYSYCGPHKNLTWIAPTPRARIERGFK